jgi:hypothetical protein
MFNFSQKQATDWRGKLANLKAMREKVRDYSVNVPGLAPVLEKELQAERDRMYSEVVNGTIQEFRVAIQAHFDAASKVDIYKRAEAARWSLREIQAEKAAILERIREIASGPIELDKRAELHNLFTEAMAGSLDRQRATLEAFEHIGEMNLPGQDIHGYPLNRSVGEFVVEARGKLGELRTTPDLAKAQQDQQAALNVVLEKHKQLSTTADGLGEPIDPVFPTGALAKASRQVRLQQNNSGPYDVYIYPEDAPEVTGVNWSKWKEGEK